MTRRSIEADRPKRAGAADLTERDLDRVADLFEMARRSSLKVDAIINEIMHEEETLLSQFGSPSLYVHHLLDSPLNSPYGLPPDGTKLLSRTIQQHQRRRSRSPVHIKVVFADRNRHIEQSRIKPVPHGVNIRKLVAGRGVFRLRRIAVKLRRANYQQSLRSKFRTQLGNDRSLRFAIPHTSAPKRTAASASS